MTLLVTMAMVQALYAPVQAQASSNAIPQWNQFHGDASHAGFSSWTGPSAANEMWTKSIGAPIVGLTSTNGLLFIGSADNQQLRPLVVSEENGSTLNTLTESCFDNTAYIVVGGGLAYIGDGQNGCGDDISADFTTGGNDWGAGGANSVSVSNVFGYWMLTYYQGELFYVPFGGSNLYAYSASSGASIWGTNLGGSIDTIPVVNDGVIAEGFANENYVLGISTTTGKQVWSFTTGSTVDASPAYSGGGFYFGTLNGTLFDVSQNGVLVWNRNLGSGIESTPAVGDGAVFVGTDSGFLYALNSTTGSEIWSKNLGSQLISSPALSSNDLVYETTTGGMLYALSGTNGQSVWSYNLEGGVVSSPVLDSGYLFVADQNGLVHAFGAPPTVTSTVSTSTIVIPITETLSSTSYATSKLTISSVVTATVINTLFSTVTATTTSDATQFITNTGTTTVTSDTTQYAIVSGTTTVLLSGSNPFSPVANLDSLVLISFFAAVFAGVAFVWRKRP